MTTILDSLIHSLDIFYNKQIIIYIQHLTFVVVIIIVVPYLYKNRAKYYIFLCQLSAFEYKKKTKEQEKKDDYRLQDR